MVWLIRLGLHLLRDSGTEEAPRAGTGGGEGRSKATRICEVTLVSSLIFKLLDQVRRSEDYAINVFQRNRGLDFAVKFLIFRFPLIAKRKPTCWPRSWNTLPNDEILLCEVPTGQRRNHHRIRKLRLRSPGEYIPTLSYAPWRRAASGET
jgi:hypothetical protein